MIHALPGVVLGQKNMPVDSVGCYPAGCLGPHECGDREDRRGSGSDRGLSSLSWKTESNSGGSHALRRSGRDLLHGWSSGHRCPGSWYGEYCPRLNIVGPGNAFVAEAKRQLFGRVVLIAFGARPGYDS